MPQMNGGGGDDLGANDELISFKDEGEQEEKISENVSAERDLDDVKSSLVNESENTSSSEDSEADRRPQFSRPDLENYARQRELFIEALRRQQDGGLFKPSPYAGYPFLMIPDLANLSNLGSPYLPNGALSPSARSYLQMAQWPLLDVPGTAALTDPRSPPPTHLSNKVPGLQHPHISHLSPLLSYSPDPFPPRTPPSHLSPDAGMSRTPHPAELSPYYPLSPGGMGQIPHHLGWLQGQSMYPITAGGFRPSYPAALAMNASMSSLVSGSFSPHLSPAHQSSIPHPAIVHTPVKQEPRDCSQYGKAPASVAKEKEEDKKPHVKKPLNAFMLYMKEQRAKVVSECTLKESAAINQILGRRWHSLTREEQAKYYDMARKERQLHSQLYPGWSARDNYGKRKKRKRDINVKTDMIPEASPEGFPPQPKRPCAPPSSSLSSCGPQEKPQQHHGAPHQHQHHQQHHQQQQQQQHHHHPHLTHTHLSQASPASSLDSPATPTTALASPAAPAPTHTEQSHGEYTAPTASAGQQQQQQHTEQVQPLSLTTKPHRDHHQHHHQAHLHSHSFMSNSAAAAKLSGPPPLLARSSSSSSSTASSSSSSYSSHMCSSGRKTPPSSSSHSRPPFPPLPNPPPPASSVSQSVGSSHHALTQSQPLSLVTRTSH